MPKLDIPQGVMALSYATRHEAIKMLLAAGFRPMGESMTGSFHSARKALRFHAEGLEVILLWRASVSVISLLIGGQLLAA